MATFICRECRKETRRSQGRVVRCYSCSWIVSTITTRCCGAVKRAVKRGLIPDLAAQFVPCPDCGERATVYDHRDYDKPLDVVAVCHGCNLRRGPARPLSLALVRSISPRSDFMTECRAALIAALVQQPDSEAA